MLVIPALIAGLNTLHAGDITGTITLDGKPPEEGLIQPLMDNPDCGKLHTEPVRTQFYVVGSKGELKDVVVTIKNITAKSTGASAEPLVLDQKGCEYIPYVSAVQTGQKITVRNSDPMLHNVHTVPAVSGNAEKNAAQIAGAPDLTFSFEAPEPFLKFKCDVHQWMFAYVTVVDNPYFSVSAKDGSYKIANVPPGKYTVEAWHRKAGKVTKEVEVKDGNASLDFTLTVPAAK
jgi:plastocyanin